MLSWHNLKRAVPYSETTELPYNERGTAKAIVSEKKGMRHATFTLIYFSFFPNNSIFAPFIAFMFSLSIQFPLPVIVKKYVKKKKKKTEFKLLV